MKNIYINGKFIVARLTGVQRVGRELSEALQAAMKRRGCDCEVLQPPLWLADSRMRILWITLWEQLVLPFKARDGLLVNLCNTAPLIIFRGQFIVFHDAAVFDMPNNYSKIYRYWTRFQMKVLSRCHHRIATVSAFSRTRLALALNRSPASFLIIREGGNHALRIDPVDGILDRLGLRDSRYVLAVASLQEGKNFHNLLRAFSIVDEGIILVIAGGGNSIVFSSGVVLRGERFLQAGYVSDGELRSLYSHALCFVQPSTYEGFGLPPVEAMTLGTPVACSYAASLPEVCAQAAIYFDPYSPADIARAINTIARDPVLREQLVSAGRERAQFYDWNVSAEELVAMLSTEFADWVIPSK
jgi:glycosyltransferase involved in cell wall biosynthesis